LINLDDTEEGFSSKRSLKIDKRYEKNRTKGNGTLPVLIFTSSFILLFSVGLASIISISYVTILASTMVSIGLSLIGYIISLSHHKKQEKEILKIDNPIELGKIQYLKMPYIATAFFFISLIFAATYVIGIYPFLPIPITHLLSSDVYEYYDYTFLFLDIAFYVITSFAMWHIFKKMSPKDFKTLRNFLFTVSAVVGFMLFVILVSIITIRSVAMPIPLFTSIFVVGSSSLFNIAIPLIFVPIFVITFSSTPDNVFLFILILWSVFLIGPGYTLKRGNRALRIVLVKWAILTMKARNTNEVKLEFHESIPQFSSGKIYTDDVEYIYLKDFLLDPLSKLGFVIDIKKKAKDILRIVVEEITLKIPEDSLKMWEKKLITALEHYSFNISQAYDIDLLSKKSGLKAEQIIAVLELSKK